jgi:hypothetical protein
MVRENLHTSYDFFKEISIETRRIKVGVQYIQPFIDQARVRGSRIGDKQLLDILDHIELFLSVIQESSDRLETISDRL